MIFLGIEGTAHTLGIGIMDSDGKVLSNAKREFVPESGGIHPREASDYHAQQFHQLLNESLEQAKVSIKEIELFAFSQGPGLGPCLRNVAIVSRALSLSQNKPMIGVNHCLAHVEVGRLVSKAIDPVTLYVSGGNTLVTANEHHRYRIFGETLDISVGNMLDVFARKMGLQHPGGPKVEKIARKSKNLIDLPYIVKGMDLSYSGLLTAAVRAKESGVSLEDTCYSIQEISFAMLTEVTERALAHTEKKSVLLTGGVAANQRLQEMLKIISDEHGATFHVVDRSLAGDNGAMIAWAGYVLYKHGVKTTIKESMVNPKWRLDEIEIPWTMEESLWN